MTTRNQDANEAFSLRVQEDVRLHIEGHDLGKSVAKEDIALFLGRTARTLELWLKKPEKVPLNCLFGLYNYLLRPKSREELYQKVPRELKERINSETCDRFPFIDLNDLQEDFDKERFIESFKRDTVFQDIILLGALKNDYHAISAHVVEKKFGSNGKRVLSEMKKFGFITTDAANYLSLPREVEVILSEFKGTCLLDEILNSRYKISEQENISTVNHGLVHTFFTGLNSDAIKEVQRMDKEYLNKKMAFLNRRDSQGSTPYFFTLNTRYDNIAISDSDEEMNQ